MGFALNTILVISYSFPLPGAYKYPPNIPKLKFQPPTVMAFVATPLPGY